MDDPQAIRIRTAARMPKLPEESIVDASGVTTTALSVVYLQQLDRLRQMKLISTDVDTSAAYYHVLGRSSIDLGQLGIGLSTAQELDSVPDLAVLSALAIELRRKVKIGRKTNPIANIQLTHASKLMKRVRSPQTPSFDVWVSQNCGNDTGQRLQTLVQKAKLVLAEIAQPILVPLLEAALRRLDDPQAERDRIAKLLPAVDNELNPAGEGPAQRPVQLEIVDAGGDRMHCTVDAERGMVSMHRAQDAADWPIVQIDDRMMGRLVAIATSLPEFEKILRYGRSNHFEDIRLRLGEGTLRTVALRASPEAVAHFTQAHESQGLSATQARALRRAKPPLAQAHRMEGYLQRLARPKRQEGLVWYAADAVRFAGGACDDIAAMAVALLLMRDRGPHDWVVYASDTGDDKHRFALLGHGDQWAVFDPWVQLASPCTLKEFDYSWTASLVAFPPGYKLPEGYEAEFNARRAAPVSSAEAIRAYLDAEPDMADYEPPSIEFADYLVQDSEITHETNPPIAERVFASNPDVRYVSPGRPEGRHFAEVPIAQWSRVVEGIAAPLRA